VTKSLRLVLYMRRSRCVWFLPASCGMDGWCQRMMSVLSNDPKMLDLEWPWHAILMLKSVFCVDLTGFVCVAFEKKDTPTLSATKCSPETVVSGNMKLMRIFAVVRCINSEKRVCVYRAPMARSSLQLYSLLTLRYSFLRNCSVVQWWAVIKIV